MKQLGRDFMAIWGILIRRVNYNGRFCAGVMRI
jgi:hypothetical protein